MDYQGIATGIIKNTELYDLYYNHYLTRETSARKNPKKYFSDRIAGSIVTLYSANNIRGNDVLALFKHLESITGSSAGDFAPLKNMMEDMIQLLSLTNYSYIPSYITLLDSYNSYNMKRSDYSFFERLIFKIELRKVKRTTSRLIDTLNHVNRDLKRKGMEHPNAVEYLSGVQREKNKTKISDILRKYSSSDILRVKTSKYQDILTPYFKEPQYRSMIEAVLDAPDIAKKSYSLALRLTDQSLLRLIASHRNEDKNKIKLLNEQRKKFTLLYTIASNSVDDPEELKGELQNAMEIAAKRNHKEG